METRETYAAWKTRIFEEFPDAFVTASFDVNGARGAAAFVGEKTVDAWPANPWPAAAKPSAPADISRILDIMHKNGIQGSVTPDHPSNQDLRRWRINCDAGEAVVEISGLEEMVNCNSKSLADLLTSRVHAAIRQLTAEGKAA